MTAAAFDRLIAPHRGYLLSSARRLGIADPDDLVQETLIRAWSAAAAGRLTLSGSPRSYLVRVLINTRLNEVRRRRVPTVPLDYATDCSADGRVDAGLMAEATAAEVRSRLSRRLAECVLLTATGADADEIAAEMGVARNTVRTRLHRARRALIDSGIQRSL